MVTDPAHPLFGREFRVISVTSKGLRESSVRVEYCKHITILIPLVATDQIERTDAMNSKLTYESVVELTSLAKEDGILCVSSQAESGKDSQPHTKKK